MTNETDDIFNFPCDFPIKIMGRSDCNLEALVLEVINRHAVELAENAISSRPSKKGNYLSVTVIIKVTSREQLDNIYRELTAQKEVLMAL